MGHRAIQLCICQMERVDIVRFSLAETKQEVPHIPLFIFFHNSLIPSILKNPWICINMMCLYSLSSKLVLFNSFYYYIYYGRYVKFLSRPEVETTVNPPAVVAGGDMVASEIKDTGLISLLMIANEYI